MNLFEVLKNYFKSIKSTINFNECFGQGFQRKEQSEYSKDQNDFDHKIRTKVLQLISTFSRLLKTN